MKAKPDRKPRRTDSGAIESDRKLIRYLRRVGYVSIMFAAAAAMVLSWDRLFPVPPEKLIEVAWTHECHCAAPWIQSLRSEGFTVRDFEMDELDTTKRRWHAPDSARGCHPARFMGYVLDGHVPAPLLHRMAQERPPAVALLQARTPSALDSRFELLAQDGTRKAWP